MADIFDDILARLVRHVPDLTLETRLNIERDIRSHHGGVELGYAQKGINGLGKSTRKFLISHGLRQSTPLPEVFSQAGVARRTGYRILGSK